MKHQALEIFNNISLFGCSNEIILIETDQDIQFFDFMKSKNNIIFSPSMDKIKAKESKFTAQIYCDSISYAYKLLNKFRDIDTRFDYILIDRIDLFDSGLNKMNRGAIMSGFVSMMCSKTILRGANLLITSQKTEYKLREISNQHYTI